MKHTKLSGLLAALLVLSASAVTVSADDDDIILRDEPADTAETYESGDYVYSRLVNTVDENARAACIERYTGSDTDVVIPDELDGLPVVALGDYAFSGADTIEHLTIPAGIVSLGTYTFADCTALLDYSVDPDNPYYEVIDGVLYGNNGAELMRYPVGRRPTEITIPDGIISIGNVAFTNCALLESVTFPDSLEYIGVCAFSDCRRLTEVTVPEGVVEIGNFAFNSCTSLRSVTLPEGLYGIGDAAFAATALESVTIPESCLSIGQQAFAETKLTEVTVPASVTAIGFAAFGWKLNSQNEMYSDDSFVMYGYRGSFAEEFANDEDYENAFSFVAITAEEAQNDADESSQAEHTAPAPVPEDEDGLSIGQIIGIALCGLAIAGILAAAIFTGKKKHKPESDSEPEQADAKEDADA